MVCTSITGTVIEKWFALNATQKEIVFSYMVLSLLFKVSNSTLQEREIREMCNSLVGIVQNSFISVCTTKQIHTVTG